MAPVTLHCRPHGLWAEWAVRPTMRPIYPNIPTRSSARRCVYRSLWPVIFARIDRSPSTGIRGHHPPESAVIFIGIRTHTTTARQCFVTSYGLRRGVASGGGG